jgi:hypothetical protein
MNQGVTLLPQDQLISLNEQSICSRTSVDSAMSTRKFTWHDSHQADLPFDALSLTFSTLFRTVRPWVPKSFSSSPTICPSYIFSQSSRPIAMNLCYQRGTAYSLIMTIFTDSNSVHNSVSRRAALITGVTVKVIHQSLLAKVLFTGRKKHNIRK